MKKFAILFAAAICMTFVSAGNAEAQCVGGRGVGFYGGGFNSGFGGFHPGFYGSGFRGVGVNVYRGGGFYRPGINYGSFRPVYGYARPAGFTYGGHGINRNFGGFGGYRGGGINIRF